MNDNVTDPSITRAEHVEENVQAKRVISYGMNSQNLAARMPVPLFDIPFDYISWSSPDGNGNYQTITLKQGGSGGTTVRTIALTYDVNSNITSLTRT